MQLLEKKRNLYAYIKSLTTAIYGRPM